MSTVIKEGILQHCTILVQERINRLQKDIHNAQDSANSDTKSSAGDKFETARAMAQLEIEKLTSQLGEAKYQFQQISMIAESKPSEVCKLGSLVETNLGWYFISISLGIVVMNDESFKVISTSSPIGTLLLNKKVGESFSFANQKIEIQSIY